MTEEGRLTGAPGEVLASENLRPTAMKLERFLVSPRRARRC